MKQFNDPDFLLENETAKDLYHNHAEKMPIIDYHCHLSPQMVAENKKFDSIAQIWLMGDHYKWRAMRSNGIAEKFCTGKDTSDWEKFEKWAETVPYTFRNPLYHWTHLELKTAFGIEKRLNPETAREIFDNCNEQIKNDPKFCPRGMMEHYNVEVVCTTDDPADSLEWHKIVKDDPTAKTRMLPTWRPDAAMNIEAPTWAAYIKKLSAVSETEICCFASLNAALQKRHDFFASMGCKLSDHGIEEFYDEPYTEAEINAIMKKALAGEAITKQEERKYKHAYMYEGHSSTTMVLSATTTQRCSHSSVLILVSTLSVSSQQPRLCHTSLTSLTLTAHLQRQFSTTSTHVPTRLSQQCLVTSRMVA